MPEEARTSAAEAPTAPKPPPIPIFVVCRIPYAGPPTDHEFEKLDDLKKFLVEQEGQSCWVRIYYGFQCRMIKSPYKGILLPDGKTHRLKGVVDEIELDETGSMFPTNLDNALGSFPETRQFQQGK